MLIEIIKIIVYTVAFFIALTAVFAYIAYCRSEKRFNAVKEPDGLDLTEDFYEKEIV